MRHFLFIAVGMACLLASLPLQATEAVFYEDFEEFDARGNGRIIPEGLERIRIGGKLPATEVEIEAPDALGQDAPMARWIPDPTGLSLTALLLDDQDTQPGDGSLGADGSVTLLEPILLDQGDRDGRAVASWMAIPMQTDQPGGTMFPETDTAIDQGPEGLNLIGFGGVFRDFDTGDPLPGQDFSGELTLNQAGSAQIASLGIGYEAEEPVFFMLDFDLENSTYDIHINGVLVQEDQPFFGPEGNQGQTLRELELISSARGTGAFIYDNLFQFDPDAEYQPVPDVPPAVAPDSPLLPLASLHFDDEPRGPLHGDESLQVVADETYFSLNRLQIAADSGIGIGVEHAASSNPLRYSFRLEPGTDSSASLMIGQRTLAQFTAGATLALDQNGDGELEETETAVIAGLPHWVSIDLDPESGDYQFTLYRATSASDAETMTFTQTGSIGSGPGYSPTIMAGNAPVFLDSISVVEINETPSQSGRFAHQAVFAENFESLGEGTFSLGDENFAIEADPTRRSFWSVAADTGQTLNLPLSEADVISPQISWRVLAGQDSVQASVLQTEITAEGESGEAALLGLLADGTVGVINAAGELESTGISYPVGEWIDFSVSVEFSDPTFVTIYSPIFDELIELELPPQGPDARLSAVRLSGESGGSVYYDDLLVKQNTDNALTAPLEESSPAAPESLTLLFDEDFESYPALSHREVNPFEARRSGLPIPTRSEGFSQEVFSQPEGARLLVGAPSASAYFVAGLPGSMYGLAIEDHFAPQDFGDFAPSLPFNPISTLRTIPYAMVVPQLPTAPSQRYVNIHWQAGANQNTQRGFTLFLEVEDTFVPVASTELLVTAPAGDPLISFGENGTLLADQNGDGQLEDLGIAYQAEQIMAFGLRIDREANTYDLIVDGETVLTQAPLTADTQAEGFLQSFGWFTTSVTDGDGQALQQDASSGGTYAIDDIRVFESPEFTQVDSFMLH